MGRGVPEIADDVGVDDSEVLEQVFVGGGEPGLAADQLHHIL
jgi:hypothetical protein